jgi:hypothetical protein
VLAGIELGALTRDASFMSHTQVEPGPGSEAIAEPVSG